MPTHGRIGHLTGALMFQQEFGAGPPQAPLDNPTSHRPNNHNRNGQISFLLAAPGASIDDSALHPLPLRIVEGPEGSFGGVAFAGDFDLEAGVSQ